MICDPGVISSFDAYCSSKESNVDCVDSQDLLLIQCKRVQSIHQDRDEYRLEDVEFSSIR